MSLSVAEFQQMIQRNPKLAPDAPPAQPPLVAPLAAPHKPVIRPSRDEQKLNKLERCWLAVLRARNVDCIGIQAVTLKLGDDCRYSPDFTGIHEGILTAWETKGPLFRDDAKVKLKAAARAYPWILFVLVTKAGGSWQETLIHP